MKIRSFFSENGYQMVRMLVTHLCMSIFGIMVSVPFNNDNTTQRAFCLLLGIFSVLLYFFLVYIQIWEVGALDAINERATKSRPTPLKGFFIGLCSALPDLLLCGAYLILWYYQAYSQGLSGAYVVMGLLTALWEGLFLGVKNAAFGSSFVGFFAIVPFVPALFAEIAYLFGRKELLPLGRKKN